MKTKLPIKFKADLELIDFAKDFAANYKKLSSGFYFSDSTMDIAKY